MEEKELLKKIQEATDEQLLNNRRNMVAEREQYEKKKAHHMELAELNEKRLPLLKRAAEISDNHNRMLEPQFAFQEDPEWISLQSQLLKLNSAQERKKIQEELDNLLDIVSKCQDELDRFAKAIPQIEAELKKRGVSYE